MKDILILYWNKGGNVERIAHQLQETIGTTRADLMDVVSVDINKLKDYKLIIAGSATLGAEHWEDVTNDNQWNSFFINLKKNNIKGLKVALFGLGDQLLYPNHFVDSLGVLYEEFKGFDTTFIGQWPIAGYDFTDSYGVENKMFYGLALDNDRQANLSPERISQWIKMIEKEL